MIVAVWNGGDTVIDVCGGLKIWGRMGGWYSKFWLRASMVEWPLEGYSDGLGDLKPAYLF